MTLDGRIFRAIALAIGTPYYCYDAQGIRAHFRKLKETLPQGIRYLYSLKANPNKTVVETLYSEGAGCEVCSLAELETALAAGAAPRDIIFVAPGKSIDELMRSVQLGLWAVIVESLPELELLNRIAASRGVVQAIGLRINPAFQPETAKLVMSGKATQFGIDENQLAEGLNLVHACNHLRLVGIHVYLGSRILDVRAILSHTKRILDLGVRTEKLAGQPLAFVDVGGGFGVNYFKGESDLDLASLGTGMGSIAEELKRRCPSTRILVELGRYLVARSGIFVTSVRYIKRCKGKLFAICDGGSNCHAAAAGFGSLFRRNFPIVRLTGASCHSAVYTLTGPLCTPSDVIGEDITLGELERGDLIGIHHSGAYGPSASPMHFLGHGHPAEVLIDEGSVQLIRRRTTVEEVLASQVRVPIELPGWPADAPLGFTSEGA
jgi:diaminopimelate decarboxylase